MIHCRYLLTRFSFNKINQIQSIKCISTKPLNINSFIQYKFSSSNYQNLSNSNFARQLGLQKQLKQVSKIQKSNERSKLRTSSILVIIVLLAFGSYVFVSVIDENQRKLFSYEFNKIKRFFTVNGKQRQIKISKSVVQHQKNLRQIFDKNYKDRSSIDIKFLTYIEQYVNQKISSNRSILNNNRIEQTKKHLPQNFIYILQKLVDKFETSSQEKIVKNKKQVLSIFQKIIYNGVNIQDKNLLLNNTSSNDLKCKLSKFLLCKGDINQQLLGLKFLQQKDSNIQPISFYLSKPQIQEINKRIQINKNIYEKSLRLSSRNDLKDSKQDYESRVIEVKQQLLYSISELKKVSQIKKAKLKYLQKTFLLIVKEIKQQTQLKEKMSIY